MYFIYNFLKAVWKSHSYSKVSVNKQPKKYHEHLLKLTVVTVAVHA